MFEKCKICDRYPTVGELAGARGHKCPPKWYVVMDWDTGGEGTPVYADTPVAAAERWMERRFDGTEYGLSWEVYVYSAETGVGQLVAVEGEITVQFNARVQENAESIPVHPFFEPDEVTA